MVRFLPYPRNGLLTFLVDSSFPPCSNPFSAFFVLFDFLLSLNSRLEHENIIKYLGCSSKNPFIFMVCYLNLSSHFFLIHKGNAICASYTLEMHPNRWRNSSKVIFYFPISPSREYKKKSSIYVFLISRMNSSFIVTST